MEISSSHNPFIKSLRRATSAGSPTEDGLIVAEGPHLLEEALRGTWEVASIVCTAASARRHSGTLESAGCEVVRVPAKTFAQISSTETAQEILALLRPRPWSWEDVFSRPALVVVLDAIQDPGNAGTIVRSAEAFGATGVLFLSSCVRVANPKFLRATAGSIFRVPYLEQVTPADLLSKAAAFALEIFALDTRSRQSIHDARFVDGCALVVGNEGTGVCEVLLRGARILRVPTGKVESLNAAVACSLALFEAHNQRMAHESF